MIPAAFQFCFMFLAINVIDRHGPRTKCILVTAKEDQDNIVLAVYIVAKDLIPVLYN